jgi:hypothetical protein
MKDANAARHAGFVHTFAPNQPSEPRKIPSCYLYYEGNLRVFSGVVRDITPI